MESTAFFQKHLEILTEQSRSWKAAHDEVTRKHDWIESLSECVAMLLFLLERIDAFAPNLNASRAKVLVVVLPQWLAAANALLELVDECERKGLRVENSDALRRERQDVAEGEDSLARLKHGVEEYEAGLCRPMDQVFDELLQRASRR